VHFIGTFFEEHFTFYGADVNGSRQLFFQDGDAKLAATVTLSHEERTRSRALLTRLRHEL